MSRSSRFLNLLIASLAAFAFALLLCLTFYDSPNPTISAMLRVLFVVTAWRLISDSIYADNDDTSSPFIDACLNTASGWFYPMLLMPADYAMNNETSLITAALSSAFVMFAMSNLIFLFQHWMSSSEIDARAIRFHLKEVRRKIAVAREAGDGAAVAELEQQLAAVWAAQQALQNAPQFSLLGVVCTMPIVALASAYWFTMLIGAPLLDARCMSTEVHLRLSAMCPVDHHVFADKFRFVNVPPAVIQPITRVDVLRFDVICDAVAAARERMYTTEHTLYVSSLGLLAAPVLWVGVLIAVVLGRMVGLSRNNVSVLELPLRFAQSLFEAPLVLLIGASLLSPLVGSLPSILTQVFDVRTPLATVLHLRDVVVLPYIANMLDMTVPAMITTMEQQACNVMHIVNAIIF